MDVAFFILQSQEEECYLQFVENQVKIQYQANKTMVIYGEASMCQALDELLWFDQKEDFIPHFYITKDSDMNYLNLPVVLVSNANFLGQDSKDILIDLSLKAELDFNQYSSLIKVVDQKPARLNASRTEYKKLQQQAHQIAVHKL